MVAFGRILLACVLGAFCAVPACAFDGPDKARPGDKSADKALEMFKDPRQALQSALESYRSGNSASSIEALKYAAAGGESLAQWKLGKMYADGDGVPRDDYRAYQYFQEIVDRYDEDNANWREKSVVASAYVAVGVFELNGIAGSRLRSDPEEAMRMFLYAATNFSDSNAEYNLARLYMDGAAGLAEGQPAGGALVQSGRGKGPCRIAGAARSSSLRRRRRPTPARARPDVAHPGARRRFRQDAGLGRCALSAGLESRQRQ